MVLQQVIDCDVESRREGVQVSVHAVFLQEPAWVPLIMDAFALLVVNHRADRANPLEPII